MARYPAQAMIAVAAAALLAGCQTVSLQPARQAQTLADEPNAAVAQAQGVRVTVDTDEWAGDPRGLDNKLTVLKATIRNQSERPLRICYRDMKLTTEQSFSYQPLPPLEIKGEITEPLGPPPFRPRFGYRGFYASPYFHPFYFDLRPWHHVWHADLLYYPRYYPGWEIPLPTTDMIERAIPEGVIAPGGHVTGFLYFQRLASDVERVDFIASLVDAHSDETFGEIHIPFVVR